LGFRAGDAYEGPFPEDGDKEDGKPALPELSVRLQLDRTWVAPRPPRTTPPPPEPPASGSSRPSKKRPMFRIWGEASKRPQPEPGPRTFKEAAAARDDVALVRESLDGAAKAAPGELSLFPNILLEPKRSRRAARTRATL